MPWSERTKNQVREEFVKQVTEHKQSMAALCRQYGISRPTGYKWLRRYEQGLPLDDQSRSPKHNAARVSTEMEAAIVAMRKKYPAIGALKLRKIMQNEGVQDLPCAKTFNNIFHRNKLITKESSLAATHYTRFQKESPNEMLQGDFKQVKMQNGKIAHVLNVTDDFSRYNMCTKALPNETFESVQSALLEVFRNYGLPFSFLCDNGTPWGNSQTIGYTKFEVWLMELGVLPLHGRKLHPQTQGKEERYNGSFSRECLKYHKEITDLNSAQQIFDEYREFYNNTRPHHALELETPASKYIRSQKELPTEISDWVYPEGWEIRKVKETGYFNYDNQGYFFSEAFAGKEIAVYEDSVKNQLTIFFREFQIAKLDLERRTYIYRRIYRIENDPRDSSH